ncbi:hypothetical protein AMTRI_Chr08g201820 [Amborella trichopoda]
MAAEMPSSSAAALEPYTSASAVSLQGDLVLGVDNTFDISDSNNHASSSNFLPPSHQEPSSISGLSYRLNLSIYPSSEVPQELRDDAWSCLVILLTFWFFAVSMTLILGFYGSVDLHLTPNYSRLLRANSFFVQEMKVKSESKQGPMLYGFLTVPPLDIETWWSESYNVSIPSNSHMDWNFYLNSGAELNVSYTVETNNISQLYLIIAKGKESLAEWIEYPSYPNTTLSWNIIDGTGIVQEKITRASDYYVAVGNMNPEDIEVQLELQMRTYLYNTSNAYYKCSLGHELCGLKLFILGANAAVLTTPTLKQEGQRDDWYVKLSYGPRWIMYFIGSGGMTILIYLTFKSMSGSLSRVAEFQASREVAPERMPLLAPKDDDNSSCCSSFGSFLSHDEEEYEGKVAAGLGEGNHSQEGGETSNLRRLCVICFDAPRDCFFLPCGHCAACFTCGSRIIGEEPGTCPICRRKMKRVRKIFTV